MDAYEYWRTIFPEVSGEEVDDFKAKYIGSSEERDDFVNAFNLTKGDFLQMAMSHLFFSKSDTAERDIALMRSLLKEGRGNKKFIPTFDKTAKTAQKKLAAYEREEEEKYNAVEALAAAAKAAKDAKKPSEKDDMANLLQLIMTKNKNKGSFLDGIAAKYMDMGIGGKASKGGKKKKEVDPMDEEAFAKFQSEVFGKKDASSTPQPKRVKKSKK